MSTIQIKEYLYDWRQSAYVIATEHGEKDGDTWVYEEGWLRVEWTDDDNWSIQNKVFSPVHSSVRVTGGRIGPTPAISEISHTNKLMKEILFGGEE